MGVRAVFVFPGRLYLEPGGQQILHFRCFNSADGTNCLRYGLRAHFAHNWQALHEMGELLIGEMDMSFVRKNAYGMMPQKERCACIHNRCWLCINAEPCRCDQHLPVFYHQ